MNKGSAIVAGALLCVSVHVYAAAADELAVRQTDFVVTDVSGSVIDPSAASSARSDGAPVAGIPHPLGLPGTFWSANHKIYKSKPHWMSGKVSNL